MVIDIDALRKENIRKYGEDTKHLDIYKNIYASGMHFIDEILQNAEDAQASKVYFILNEKELKIFHNGRDFSEADVRGICSISESPKKEGSIGKFGIGFKSVYAITETPRVYTKDLAFEIQNYVRPYKIAPQFIGEPYTTLFVFKIKHEDNCEQQIYNKLENLNLHTLLFLHNIKEIKYRLYNDKEGKYTKITKKNGITILSDENKNVEKWLIFSEKYNQKQNIDIAYKLEKSKIVPVHNAKLFVYFQTDKDTKLKFLINGPFETTPARDNIKENKINNEILNSIANLIVNSIEKIKKENLLTIDFLNVLPIETNNFRPFYGAPAWDVIIYDKIKEGLSARKWVPTNNGKFTSLNNAVLARSTEISKLYTIANKCWISPEISSDKTLELWNYMSKECKVEIITPEKFIQQIDENLVLCKPNKWFIKLYQFLDKQKSLHPNLKHKPIIRLGNGATVPPFIGEQINAFICSAYEDSEANIVAKDIIKDNISLAFLQNLGLKEFDYADYIITSFDKKYNESTPDVDFKSNQEDIKKLAEIFEKSSDDERCRIISRLKKIHFIYAQNLNEIFSLKSIDEVYICNELTKKYFSGYFDIWYPNFKYTANVIDSLKMLGVFEYPRLIVNTNIDKPQHQGYTLNITNYDIDGLQSFIKNISTEKSYLLWQVITNLYAKNNHIFKATRKYSYYYEKTEDYPSIIFNLLTQNAWVTMRDGSLKKPSELSFDELPDIVKKIPYAKEISQELEFKIDEIHQIELKTGGRLIVGDELKEFEEWQKLKQQKTDEISTKWEPECQPEDVDVKSQMLKTHYLGCIEGTRPKNNNISINGAKKEELSDSSVQLNNEKVKEIGRWGENFVKLQLEKEYPLPEYNVIDLNQNDCGIGYDFEIRKDGKIISHIEVKTSIYPFTEQVNVSGNQWKIAQKYYNEDKGDSYYIYIVSDAGTKNAKIHKLQNPVKMWKEGKLDAHPVNLIIHI